MAMSLISPLIAEAVDTNLIISTQSARILASQFTHTTQEFWLPLITSVAAVVAAFMSYLASRKSVQLTHNILINELNKEFAEIKDRMYDEFNENCESGILNKNKDRMCGFFEKICGLHQRKLLNNGELFAYSAIMKTRVLMKYAKVHNTKEDTLNQYVLWLKKNVKDFDSI